MDADPLTGRTLGDFSLEALIGRGAMGTVYRAEQRRLGRKVALKVLVTELAASDEFRARFLSESRIAASIDHPNILPVFDAGEVDGLLYIAMRLVEGSGIELEALLEREGPLAPEQAVTICAQVASALDAAHRRGLIHRDVKPGNVLLAGDHVYLADFGIAKANIGRRELTRTGAFLGTLDYASPEQIQNDAVDAGSDIYSLGAILFRCLTGRVPFDGPSEYAVMKAHLEEPVPSATALRPELPAEIDAVLETAMAKERDVRYRSGRHLIEAARTALAGGAVTRPPSWVHPTLVRRPPAASTAAAAPSAAAPRPAPPRAATAIAILALAAAGATSVLAAPMLIPKASIATLAPSAAPTKGEGDVSVGSNVTTAVSDPESGVSVKFTFPSVNSAGKVRVAATAAVPALPSGMRAVGTYDVSITANFAGMGLLCIADSRVTGASRLVHYATDRWVDRTSAVTPPEICGLFPSFSPVAIVVPVSAPIPSPTPTLSSTPIATPTPTPTSTSTPRTGVVTPTRPTISSLGCASSVQTFQSVSCYPSVSGTTARTTYQWSAFGGSPSGGSGSIFSTSFGGAATFTITLTACNGGACESRSQDTVVTSQAPRIVSLGCASSVQTLQTVSCFPSISGAAVSATYRWSASGGSPSGGSGSTFLTSFEYAGFFAITLTVCNGPNACAGDTQSIYITAPAAPAPVITPQPAPTPPPPTPAPVVTPQPAPTPPPPTPTPLITPQPAPTPQPPPPCNIPSKTDINPSTGKAYAVNPSTGVWDDNYWANVVEPDLKRQYGCY